MIWKLGGSLVASVICAAFWSLVALLFGMRLQGVTLVFLFIFLSGTLFLYRLTTTGFYITK